MMVKDVFYVTTPIYYVNDEPHIGHAYTTILADVLARYARLFDRQTFYLTGTDEHGQKVRRAATLQGVSPLQQADEMVQRYLNTWDTLQISYDDFIRTTEERHIQVVQNVLQALWESGDIYLGEYRGWYCVPDERFWTEKDLVNGNCPDCGRQVEELGESNYFFRMSHYQSWLIDYIEDNPSFIQPSYRRNEVLGFLTKPLGDLCITRPVSRMDWGIRLPFDDNFVTYVWFDALLNYVTAAGYLSDPERFELQWSQAIHLIGKDILTTHCVYWPTMLKAAGLPQPKTIFAHGWWILSGTKMSKSIGNIVKPLDLINVYGVDPFRYFLIRDMTLGRDSEFSISRMANRYEKELANDLGNLLSRVLSMVETYFQGRIPGTGGYSNQDSQLKQGAERLLGSTQQLVTDFALNGAISEIMTYISGINVYLEQTSPWAIAKSGDYERVGTILYSALEALRLSSILLHPVMPEKTAALWGQLGWQPAKKLSDALSWGLLEPGAVVSKGAPLFPRIELS
ncbi:MAG TPA: methionine--tRNA ligase [candidate division Zixibacteria bacterium]|nr:methionine--tRNA ligase [candidate division Zixibacteria bacterium]